VRIFYATSGFNTVYWSGTGLPTLTSVGSSPVSDQPAGSLAAAPTDLKFTATATQMAGFMHDRSSTSYTDAAAWHKASGSLAFDSVVLGD